MGGLNKQQVQIPIDTGLDQYTDKRLAVDLLEAENIQYVNKGSVQKRYGNKSLVLRSVNQNLGTISAPIGPPPAPNWIREVNDQLVRVGQNQCATYSEAQNPSQNGQWEYAGLANQYTAEQSNLTSTNGLISEYDSILVGNFRVVTWLEGAEVTSTPSQVSTGMRWMFTVFDHETGACITRPRQLRASSSGGNIELRSPKLAVAGNVVTALVYHSGTSGNTGKFWYISMDFSGGVVPSIPVAADLGVVTRNEFVAMDFIGIGTSGFLLAYELSAGATRVQLKTYNTSMGLVSTYTDATGETNWQAFSLTYSSNIAWLTMGKSTANGNLISGIRVNVSGGLILSSATAYTVIINNATPAAPVNVRRISTAMYGGLLFIAYELYANLFGLGCIVVNTSLGIANGRTTFTKYYKGNGNTLPSIVGPVWNVMHIMSRPFVANDMAYIVVYQVSHELISAGYTPIYLELQGSTSLLAINLADSINFSTSRLKPTAIIAPRRCYNYGIDLAPYIDPGLTITTAVYPNVVQNIVVDSDGNFNFLISNDELPSHLSDSTIFSIKLNTDTRLVPSLLSNAICDGSNFYDGIRCYEPSFLWFPSNVEVSLAGGGRMDDGTFVWTAIYAYVLPSGAVERSAVGFTLSMATVGAGKKATVTVPTLTVSRKEDFSKKILIEVYRSESSGSGVLRLVGSVPNDQSVATVTLLDNLANFELASQPILYSLTELDNVQPPTGYITAYHQSRLFIAGTDDDTIWFSKDASDGPVRFNEGFTIPQFEGGKITALGVLDDKLIVFKRRSIHYIYGRGPNANGQGDQYSEPIQLAAGIGCISARSIVTWGKGIFFQADQGLYLLQRDLQVVNLSKDIVTELDDHVITAGTRIDALTEIRFALLNETDNTGSFIIYNWYLDAWTLHRAYDGSTAAIRGAEHATTWQGVYTWITPEGQAYQEDDTQFRDIYNGVGTWVTESIRTSWLKLSGLSGYQRIYRVGVLLERLSNAGITIEIYTDFNDSTPTQSVTFSDQDLSEMSLQQLVIHVKQQKCQAIQVRVVDVASASGTGIGCKITGIVVQYGVKGGLPRVGQSQRG